MTAVTSTSTTTEPDTVRFELPRAALTEALTTVALAVPTHPEPVPGGIMLDGDAEGCLHVRAFDGRTAVAVRIPDAASGPGSILLNHDDCTKTVNALVKGTPKREADRMTATITADSTGAPTVELAGATMPLQSHAVQEYPALPESPAPVAHMDLSRFSAEAGRVLYTIEDNDVWPQAAGVQFEALPVGLVLSATDRYRLGVAHVPTHTEIPAAACTTTGGALVPGYPLARILRRLRAATVAIGIGPRDSSPRLVSLDCGDISMVVHCIDAEFPDYHRVRPRPERRTHPGSARRRGAGRQRRQTPARDPGRRRRRGPALAGAVGARRAGGHTASSRRDHRHGWAPRMHFKPEFLTDALETVAGPGVRLHLPDTETGAVLFTEDYADLSDPLAFRHLLKPIHVR
ncbi:hypothetical protein [Streptomonospora arabica]|uniref:DNA polymerase III beta sliding clamp central domain-containing protein n=1 Tax=Streptomonospora arabica TaxID=412417 RepID=A0ABV9SG98_9ACTN